MMSDTTVLAVLWALAVTVFWMVVGWRAMRAHEHLAESVHRLSDQGRGHTERI